MTSFPYGTVRGDVGLYNNGRQDQQMKNLKRVFAYVLVAFFVMMIASASSRVIRQPDNVAQAAGAITGYLLLFVGLYYTVKWSMKLSGHTYKVGRQTVAKLPFWYSVVAALVGLMMPLVKRNTFGFGYAAVMLIIWSTVAYACWQWRQRLRRAERSHLQGAPTLPIIPLST
jgi:hypothetical protein